MCGHIERIIKPTTKTHFKIFCKEAAFWVEYFGMKSWSIYYKHEQPPFDDNVRACCCWDKEAKQAVFTLSTFWDDSLSDAEVRRSAFHEVCELLLAEIQQLASERFLSSEEVLNNAAHTIIQTLTNTVFKDINKLYKRTSKLGDKK